MGSEVIQCIMPGMDFGRMQPEECVYAGDSNGTLSFKELMESRTLYMAVAADATG